MLSFERVRIELVLCFSSPLFLCVDSTCDLSNFSEYFQGVSDLEDMPHEVLPDQLRDRFSRISCSLRKISSQFLISNHLFIDAINLKFLLQCGTVNFNFFLCILR